MQTQHIFTLPITNLQVWKTFVLPVLTGNPIRPLACGSSNPIWEASPHLQGHQVSLAIDPFSNQTSSIFTLFPIQPVVIPLPRKNAVPLLLSSSPDKLATG